MKKINLVIAVLMAVLTVSSLTFAQNKPMKKDKKHMMTVAQMDKNKDGKVFQCSMCADQISDKPGNCQECGMKLSEVSVDKASKALMGSKGHMMMGDKKEAKKMEHKHMSVANMDMNKDGKVFQCSMCADQISDKPGNCQECGMKLTEVSVEKAQKALMGSKGHMMKDGKKAMNHPEGCTCAACQAAAKNK